MIINIHNGKDHLATVTVNGDEITAVEHKKSVFQPFRTGNVSKELFDLFLEERVFSFARPDRDELLEMLELTQYDRLEIAKKTHGIMLSDFTFLVFDDENFTWEDAYEIISSGD